MKMGDDHMYFLGYCAENIVFVGKDCVFSYGAVNQRTIRFLMPE